MKPIIKFFSLFFFIFCGMKSIDSTFEEKQLTFDRVQKAYSDKLNWFQQQCSTKNVPEKFSNIFIRVFKYEKEMEIWVEKDGTYFLFELYPICAASGILGPKRKQGDEQVPEGLYHIEVFNPLSKYFLSLGINYPNQSDKILSSHKSLGGDIYIHGDCASIGCLSMTDGLMEEIYLMSVKAKSQGQETIPVHIFPFRMTTKNMSTFLKKEKNQSNISLWKNLNQAYLFFETNKIIPKMEVNSDGYYEFTKNPSSITRSFVFVEKRNK